MKRPILFSEETAKNVINLSSTEFAQSGKVSGEQIHLQGK